MMNSDLMDTPELSDDEFDEMMSRLNERESRGKTATTKGALALQRLLNLAETRNSGQIHSIAQFIGACWNGRRHFNFFDLRILDTAISDDMLAVLDALRWAQADIENMVPDGHARVEAVLALWGMFGNGQHGQFICV
jgi:hypothetical protein